jgi:hypothetical protein
MNLEFYKSDSLYGTFSQEMTSPLTYLGLFLIGGTLFATENILKMIDMVKNKGSVIF